ncbi:MAG: hypothetical protein AAFQ81_11840, partial [Pseudomonadota bacterium]
MTTAVYAPDRVLMTTTTNSTGDLSLDGVVPGFRSIQAAVADGGYAYGDPGLWTVEDVDSNGNVLQSETI